MFDSIGTSDLSTAELRAAIDRLSGHDGADLDESELVEQITAMERLKSALAAGQARMTATLYAARSAREAAAATGHEYESVEPRLTG